MTALSLPPPSRLPAIGLTLAVHLLAVLVWMTARPPHPPAPAALPSSTVWLLSPPPVRKPLPPPPVPTAAPARPPRAALVLPAASVAATAPAAPAAAPAPAPSLDQPAAASSLRAQALQAAGKADAAERGGTLAPGKLSAANARLAAAIEAATRQRFGKGTEITEISDGSGFGAYGDRVYKVKGPFGTVCARVESNAQHRGNDPFRSTPPPIWITNC
ncbi:hypothetical protein [Massilia sp. TS11]|uniref:hypothetical protein n=1 Tax=Massilia sp. TS11 TaxID=2908003 RepID=UPI001EDB86A7|nr:hypothetical protein [Massilia sp. TS11]MCG2584456.1 hypothetical protein [Massilia sp. TS11]